MLIYRKYLTESTASKNPKLTPLSFSVVTTIPVVLSEGGTENALSNRLRKGTPLILL